MTLQACNFETIHLGDMITKITFVVLDMNKIFTLQFSQQLLLNILTAVKLQKLITLEWCVVDT